ncbi:uncharacterized protein LOC116656557 isoform X2 [Drosophila ananassae]|uniref:uncharacterized protein LOC116656557 isoform X2 n=1 Tax=Drosophila ananassae TaxID=7217 RepID=UPI001CFFADDD|nr:uncharacterized protein LOC116656557 isoform X2 [Drosophila ananassae]
MDIIKTSLLGILLYGFFLSSSSQVTDCSGACNLQFRCNPYDKHLYWAISEGVCRVFKNGCFFSSHNCQRENRCLRPRCIEYCQVTCPLGGPQVCASFSYVDARMNRDRQRTFQNRCYLDQFSCQYDNAYIGEPSIGPCS